jgi:hypothetical protein
LLCLFFDFVGGSLFSFEGANANLFPKIGVVNHGILFLLPPPNPTVYLFFSVWLLERKVLINCEFLMVLFALKATRKGLCEVIKIVALNVKT